MAGSRGNQIDYRGYLITLPGRLIRVPRLLLNTVEYMWGVVQMERLHFLIQERDCLF
jgi:starvation-inducible outer membrane lipoprotein